MVDIFEKKVIFPFFSNVYCLCYVLRFLDFVPYKNSEGVRLRNLGDC